MSSLYYILEDFLRYPHENVPRRQLSDGIRTVVPGAPGRISFVKRDKQMKQQRVVKKYNPSDWPEEEELPMKKR